jgi:hypothetical protein
MDIIGAPTVTDPDTSVQDVQKPSAAPIAAETKRGSIWPVLLIIVGMVLTLAWSGFLGWAVFRTIGFLLG